jgi:hypothetical protein
VKLESNQLARIESGRALARPVPVEPVAPARPVQHGERVTLSARAQEAGEQQQQPTRAEVRWYKAVMFRGHGRLTASDGEAAGAPLPPPSPLPPMHVSNPQAAVAAYRRVMQEAAA